MGRLILLSRLPKGVQELVDIKQRKEEEPVNDITNHVLVVQRFKNSNIINLMINSLKIHARLQTLYDFVGLEL